MRELVTSVALEVATAHGTRRKRGTCIDRS